MCLDIDDTLIDFTSAGRGALAAMIGRADMWPLWDEITEAHVAMVVAGTLDYTQMHVRRTKSFLAELGVQLDELDASRFEQSRAQLMRSSWRLYDDVIECLDWLRAAGVRIAAVTNASGAHQRKKIADLGLSRFVDHIAIAGEVGVAKPDPMIFLSACAALECEPSEAVHVGDRLTTDAIGARDAGLTGVWLNRDRVEADVPEHIFELAGLDELPELLVSEFARIGMGPAALRGTPLPRHG